MKTFLYALLTALLVAGQIFSPTLANSAADTTADITCKETYIIRRGDSLGKIAKKCNITLQDLLAANPEIQELSIIYPGQALRIIQGVSIPNAGGLYTVRSGDTLSTIAERFDTTVKELLRLNPDILDPRIIYIDQALRLPGNQTGPWINLLTDRVKAGGLVQVEVFGLPANVDIDYRAGKQGGAYTIFEDGVTDENGYATENIYIPSTAKVGERWIINVSITEIKGGVLVTSRTILVIK